MFKKFARVPSEKFGPIDVEDPRLRTEFVLVKWVNSILLVVWLLLVVSLFVWEAAIPRLLFFVGIALVWIIMPDIESVKDIFRNFDSYRQRISDQQSKVNN